MATQSMQEVLPPSLDTNSLPPAVFDGTTRLYFSYVCPFSQRVWIARNFKGLQEKIKLVPIEFVNRPNWYKEKVYPTNQVPCLEYNKKVMGESLELVKFIDNNFEGPSLMPDDPEKQKFAEELIAYVGTFINDLYAAYRGRDVEKQAGVQFDWLEKSLQKFDDGPFFLGQFSQADIAYIPFIQRIEIYSTQVLKYDMTAGRTKLATWFEEYNKIDAYKVTKVMDSKVLIDYYKSKFQGSEN